MNAISVIVTACNCQRLIARTLRTLDEAITIFRRHASRHPEPEVVIVDDGSADGTPETVVAFMHGKPSWQLIRRPRPSSPSCARNVGVRHARGDLLFFLDGDDLFLPDHLLECCRALEQGNFDFVKTGVRLADPVHPDWKPRIEFSIVINLAIRRHCHDFVGGFPDYHLCRRQGDDFVHEEDIFYKAEDMFYNLLAHRFFRGVTLAQETVEYCRHPGNGYDRQYEKFSRPFAGHQPPVGKERFRLQLAELLFQTQVEELQAAARAPNGLSTALGPSPHSAKIRSLQAF